MSMLNLLTTLVNQSCMLQGQSIKLTTVPWWIFALILLDLNTILTAKVIAWRFDLCGTYMCFLAF